MPSAPPNSGSGGRKSTRRRWASKRAPGPFQPPAKPTNAAEWGYDINRAVSDAASGIWWTGLFPGLAIVLLVTGLTLLGEGLNETVNPVLRRRTISKVDMASSMEVAEV